MQVSDHKTWPAHLERLQQQSVVNGGVLGCGIDQIVLRARQLLPRVDPEWLVLSLIPDDITRCELWIRGAQKPCYRLVDGVLRLENQPVPPPGTTELDWVRRVFGHSWVIHTVQRRLSPSWLQRNSVVIQAHNEGDAVASALLCQLAEEAALRRTKLLIVAQADEFLDPEELKRAAAVLNSLHQQHLFVLNLLAPLGVIKEKEPLRFQSYFNNHMTGLGNRYVAEQIVRALKEP